MNFNSSDPVVCPSKLYREYRYSSTSTLEEDEWFPLASVRFSPGKETRYPFYRRLHGLQPVWRENLAPYRGWKPRTAQPVVSRHTNYDTLVVIVVVQLEVIQMLAFSV